MKAFVYDAYGGSSVLHEATLPVPEPEATEVLVKVHAAGINPVDWMLRAGYIPAFVPLEFPVVPGWDLAGEVAADGNGFKKGDRVLSFTRPASSGMIREHPESKDEVIGARTGAAAQYAAVRAFKLARIPASLSYVQAASIPLAALTAYQALLDQGGLAAGQTVLIPGASGGVGSFAVGLAKNAGAHVIASCSKKNEAYVRSLGADRVVDYGAGALDEQLKGENVDVVFDCVGGAAAEQCVRLLAPGKTIVSIAAFNLADIEKDKPLQRKYVVVNPDGEQLQIITDLLDQGKLKLPQITEMPWTKIAEAHDASMTARTVGKIVLVVE